MYRFTVLFGLPHQLFSSPPIAAATTAAAEAAAAAAVFAGHDGDPSLTGTRAGLLLRPPPSAPSPLRTKFRVNKRAGVLGHVEHVFPCDVRYRHRHGLNPPHRPWMVPLTVFEIKLTFSKSALAQEQAGDTLGEDFCHRFECRLGATIFYLDRVSWVESRTWYCPAYFRSGGNADEGCSSLPWSVAVLYSTCTTLVRVIMVLPAFPVPKRGRHRPLLC